MPAPCTTPTSPSSTRCAVVWPRDAGTTLGQSDALQHLQPFWGRSSEQPGCFAVPQVDVNGPNASTVFRFLKEHTPADMGGSADIDWNFAKWVVRLLTLVVRYLVCGCDHVTRDGRPCDPCTTCSHGLDARQHRAHVSWLLRASAQDHVRWPLPVYHCNA